MCKIESVSISSLGKKVWVIVNDHGYIVSQTFDSEGEAKKAKQEGDYNKPRFCLCEREKAHG